MLLRLFGAFIAGVLCGLPWAFVALPLLCASRPRSWRRTGAWVPPVLLAVLAGAWEPGGPAPQIASGTVVRVQGWVASRPQRHADAGSARCVLRALSVAVVDSADTHVVRSRGHLMLRRRGDLPPYGSRIVVEGRFEPPRTRRNFHGWVERDFLRARDAWGTLYAGDLRVVDRSAGGLLRRQFIEPLRTRLADHLGDVLTGHPQGLLLALLLGMRGALDPALQDAWRALGMAHVLALSGMHVGVVAAGLLACAGSVRRRRGLAVVLGGVFLYAALGGSGSSVLRASFMVACAVVATYLGRARHPLRQLGTAAFVLLASAPHRLHDLGFQLSCSATLGILVVAGPLARWALRQRRRARPLRLLAWAVPAGGVGIAAQVATLPWIVHHFGMVSWMSPLANLLLVPWVDAALVLGLAGAAMVLFVPDLARPLWLVAAALLHTVAWLSLQAVAHFEPRVFLRPETAVLVLAGLAATGFVTAMLCRGTTRRAAAVLAVLGLAATFVLGGRPSRPDWRLEMLDVGQGDAVLLRLGTANWLFDAGHRRPLDQGARTVVPHLRRQGIDHLRGVVVSHPHEDHHGGVRTLLEEVRVDTVYVATASWSHRVYRSWRSAVPSVPHRGLQAGDSLRLAPQVIGTVLWPPPTDVLGSGANGVSLTLWIRAPSFPDVLMMGDLEEDGEHALVSSGLLQRSGIRDELLVLKAGHHGSDTSSTPAFLDAIDAEIALISAGRRNRYGHPAASTLEALRARGCVVLRTDRGGDIRLEARGRSVWLARPSTRPRLLEDSARGIDDIPTH